MEGRPVGFSKTVAFKGMMLGGVPSQAYAVSYTNSSWTVKIGLIGEHFCRLLDQMDRIGADTCEPRTSDPGMKTRPFRVEFCERMLGSLLDLPGLSRSIRTACLNGRERFPTRRRWPRGLARRCACSTVDSPEQGLQYQQIVDDVLRSLAIDLLRDTTMSAEEIAGRVGFSDASSFREAFRKWASHPPFHLRASGSPR